MFSLMLEREGEGIDAVDGLTLLLRFLRIERRLARCGFWILLETRLPRLFLLGFGEAEGEVN